MEKEVLVKVEGLSKKFCKDLKTSLWYGVKDLVSQVSGNKEIETLRPKEFWALKDINFELRRGECLGLIGHNGAGKSTLLKILNGLINPDQGKVTMRGRVGALIELGAGFNPILTGRENIYNNGAVLGFTRKEIDAKVEEIIDFSEIREFIDMPVQNYSSGMKVRLGFAVAAQMEPDILIIDEVLAVGDLGFRLKCFKSIDEILPNTAIIFVSHNMPMISKICDKIILLNRGEYKYNGPDVSKAIDLYYNKIVDNTSKILFDNGTLELQEIKLIDSDKIDEISTINWGQDLCIAFSFFVKRLADIPLFKIVIFDQEQKPVAVFSENKSDSPIKIEENQINFKITHKGIQLSKGVYTLSITVFKFNTIDPIFRINQAISFQILHQDDHYQSFLLDCEFESL